MDRLAEGKHTSNTELSQRSHTAQRVSVAFSKLLDAGPRKEKKMFENLYDECINSVYSLALSILQSKTLAEDAAQSTMVNIWEKRKEYDSRKGSALTWILTIAHHRSVDLVRKEERQKEQSKKLQEVYLVEPEKKELDLDLDLERALETLDSHQNELIRLSYFQGKTHEEIANMLEMPIGTVKSQLYSALRLLRWELGGYHS